MHALTQTHSPAKGQIVSGKVACPNGDNDFGSTALYTRTRYTRMLYMHMYTHTHTHTVDTQTQSLTPLTHTMFLRTVGTQGVWNCKGSTELWPV